MKISYQWLNDYLALDLPPEKLAGILTNTGLEVEGIEEWQSLKGGLEGVVIGKVLECRPHPNADRLKLTQTDIGEDQPRQIVCGAPNVATGQSVAVATVGSTIYPEGKALKIKKAKIRGEVSEGMICAEDELGLGESHDGIMLLSTDLPPGTPATEYFDVVHDHIFEIGLTPNRTDAMCHYGVARDIRAALLQHQDQAPDLSLPSVRAFSVSAQDLLIDIKIENSEACARYAGVSLKNLKVAPSPLWLQHRLRAIGLGPVNNVVDITNYVLHETGHPLHAFDADKIAGREIRVKNLPEGTAFTTLDGKERHLSAEDLMICDAEKPLVIAGVFGGTGAAVTKETTSVFLESAYFDPVSIRKTARRHGLNTDASFRYERGVDPEMTLYALKRAALLISEIAGGEVAMHLKDVQHRKVKGHQVQLNLTRMTRLIGQEIPRQAVRSILQSLDIHLRSEAGDDLLLEVPAYRTDVTREADVVEEVLRIYGFDRVALPEKMSISLHYSARDHRPAYRKKISQSLMGRGFHQIMNNSLTRPGYFEHNGFDPEASVHMLNPLSNELSALRQSLVYGGLESIARNLHRQRPDLRFFEFGKTYHRGGEKFAEHESLGLWITGRVQPENWYAQPPHSDFYQLKAEVENLLRSLGIEQWNESSPDHPLWQYGLAMTAGKKSLFRLGRVADDVCARTDVEAPVYYAEADWDQLSRLAGKQRILFAEMPRYPEVRRDLALLLDRDISYRQVEEVARKNGGKSLKQINLFDVYEGKNLPEGKKSYALSFVLRDDSKTLQDKQVDNTLQNIRQALEKECGASLR